MMKQSHREIWTWKKGVGLSAAAAAFGATLGHPAVSEAFWARQHSDEPVAGTLILDCADWKAKGSPPLETEAP